MITFEWAETEYRIGRYDKHNIAVGRVKPGEPLTNKRGHRNWGRKTYHRSLYDALRRVMGEGVREIEGETVEDILNGMKDHEAALLSELREIAATLEAADATL